MCIACELGYWVMIDALEAERASKGEIVRINETDFVCDEPAEPQKPKSSEQSRASEHRE
jgi:hypothetical protein